MASEDQNNSHPKDIADRELLRLHGLNTKATGPTLAELASRVARYPPDNSAWKHASVTFKPFYFFFYGSLQVQSVLQRVCKLGDAEQELKPATIKGWRSMMWGPYPALVPKEGSEVVGMCWKCENPRHVGDLQTYESSAYRMEFCKIITDDGEVIDDGRVFVSTEDESELEDRAFDLEEFKNGYY